MSSEPLLQADPIKFDVQSIKSAFKDIKLSFQEIKNYKHRLEAHNVGLQNQSLSGIKPRIKPDSPDFTAVSKLKKKEEIDQQLKDMSNFYSLLMDALDTLDQLQNTDEQARENLVSIKDTFDKLNESITEDLQYIAVDLRKSTNLQKIGGASKIT